MDRAVVIYYTSVHQNFNFSLGSSTSKERARDAFNLVIRESFIGSGTSLNPRDIIGFPGRTVMTS